jgi:hypothetical protein
VGASVNKTGKCYLEFGNHVGLQKWVQRFRVLLAVVENLAVSEQFGSVNTSAAVMTRTGDAMQQRR